ncbi:hypothetical protein BROUX41_003276 [Berkeleyomyces rouxiae]|uniref:uncharacterized protein n=1 Tax=Berkeleyomyces rouxiae TaxID=2035830 RepID=UPI003B7A9479
MKTSAILSFTVGFAVASTYGEPPSYGSPSPALHVSSWEPVYPGSSSRSSSSSSSSSSSHGHYHSSTAVYTSVATASSTEHWPGETVSSAQPTPASASVSVPTEYLTVFSDVVSYTATLPEPVPPVEPSVVSSYLPLHSSAVSSGWTTSVVSSAEPTLPEYSYGAPSSAVPPETTISATLPILTVTSPVSEYPPTSSASSGSLSASYVSSASPVTQSNNGSAPSYTDAVPSVFSTAGAARLLPFRFF